MQALYPNGIVCAGEEFCVPIQNCPPGFTLEVEVVGNPSDGLPPTLLEVNEDHVVMVAGDPGDYRLRFACCDPEV